ncbi:hypothetical protein [Psychrobacter sp. PL15]
MSEIKMAVGSSACSVLQPTVKKDKTAIMSGKVILVAFMFLISFD